MRPTRLSVRHALYGAFLVSVGLLFYVAVTRTSAHASTNTSTGMSVSVAPRERSAVGALAEAGVPERLVVVAVHAGRQDRLDAISRTWARPRAVGTVRVRFVFFTSQTDLAFPQTVEVVRQPPSASVLDKTVHVMHYLAKQYPEAVWYGKFDDDVFADIAALVEGLNVFDPSSRLFLGNSYDWHIPGRRQWMSGGAGYVLSYTAMHAVIPVLELCNDPELNVAEDRMMDNCLRDYVEVTRIDHPGFHWTRPEAFVYEGLMSIPRLVARPITFHYVSPQRCRDFAEAPPAPREVIQVWPFAERFESSRRPEAVRMRKCRQAFVDRGWGYHMITADNWQLPESCGGTCSSFRYIQRVGSSVRELLGLLERLYLVGGLALHSSVECRDEDGAEFDLQTLLLQNAVESPRFGSGRAALIRSAPGAETASFVALAATPYHHDVFRLYGLATVAIRNFDPAYYTEFFSAEALQGVVDTKLTDVLGRATFVNDAVLNYQLAFSSFPDYIVRALSQQY